MNTEHLPHRNSDTLVAAFDDSFVVFDPRCGEVHLIEALSAVIFDACDGTPWADVAGDLVAVLGLDPPTADAAIANNVLEFERLGLLHGTAAIGRPP